MKGITRTLRAFVAVVRTRAASGWKWFRGLRRWLQIVIVVGILVVVVGIVVLAHGGTTDAIPDTARTVTLASVNELSGGTSGVGILGTVRSVTQADVIAQAGGVVHSVSARVGNSVGAGAVLASLDNASEAAALLQAQGAYDAAVAARSATTLQSGNAQQTLTESAASVRDLYQSSFSSADSALKVNVDVFYGPSTPSGPSLLISPGASGDSLSRERATIADLMASWRASLAASASTDPSILLTTASANLAQVSSFLNDLAVVANRQSSGASPAQLGSLAQARATLAGLISSVSSARDAYNAKKTAAAVSMTQSQSTESATAGADATVKQALGALRGAQAVFEKTVIRAPIAGTVNVLSIHVGDFVAPSSNVATIARNNALEIVAYISGDNKDLVAAGDAVTVEASEKGIVTSVAPALDPITKQIEVHIAVDAGSTLVDGESVHITLPNILQADQQAAPSATATASLPLASVKLRATDRVVFTVDSAGHLVAHAVTIGDVIGDRIEVLSGLTPDLRIVTDARGLSEGDVVQVATSTGV